MNHPTCTCEPSRATEASAAQAFNYAIKKELSGAEAVNLLVTLFSCIAILWCVLGYAFRSAERRYPLHGKDDKQ